MDLSNFKPVIIGSKYVVKLEKFSKSVYLGTTSKGVVIEVGIELAREVNSLQEVTDLAYAYVLNINYKL
jgi:hypothetical protein